MDIQKNHVVMNAAEGMAKVIHKATISKRKRICFKVGADTRFPAMNKYLLGAESCDVPYVNDI